MRKAASIRMTSVEAPLFFKVLRQATWSSLLNAFEKSTADRTMADLLSSSAWIVWSIRFMRRWVVLAPGSPPYWLSLGTTSSLAHIKTWRSNTFDKKFVQEIFRQSSGPSCVPFPFGIMVTYSVFHFLGHALLMMILLNTDLTGPASSSGYWLYSCGLISPKTLDWVFLHFLTCLPRLVVKALADPYWMMRGYLLQLTGCTLD